MANRSYKWVPAAPRSSPNSSSPRVPVLQTGQAALRAFAARSERRAEAPGEARNRGPR